VETYLLMDNALNSKQCHTTVFARAKIMQGCSAEGKKP